MKKLVFAIGLLGVLMLPASAAASTPPHWDLTGTYKVTFVCTSGCSDTYIHSMTITTSDDVTGAVTGSGSVDGYAGYTWTLTGQITGQDGSDDTVDLTITWTAPPETSVFNPLVLTGTIDSNGNLSGTAVDGLQREFTWSTTDGHATAIATPTPAPTATATPTPFESLAGETATPVSTTTPPPTSTDGPSQNSQSTPFFMLLISAAFGGLGLVVIESQRRTYRR